MVKKAPVLEVKNLVKKFPSSVPFFAKATNGKKTSEGKGEFTAVDGISFSVSEGEILGFLGPNGAGKSTTINCLLGVVEKDGGEIRMFGKDVSKHRVEVMQKVNYCSAEYNLPWHL